MQVLNTYSISPYKLNYNHPNKEVKKRVKHLFHILDNIILEKRKNDIYILSNEYIKLLNDEIFFKELERINKNIDLFDKYQKLFYVLIKYKFFKDNDSIRSDNSIIIFISLSLTKFINNSQNRFYYILQNIPNFDTFNDILDQIWEKYNYNIIHFIVTYGVFPYIIQPVFDYRRICTHCDKISNVTFIRCYGCRVFYYCSNLCQNRDYNNHKKICPNIYPDFI